MRPSKVSPDTQVGSNKELSFRTGKEVKTNICIKCGAWCGNLGLEPEFDLYIKHLCDIFDEIKRILKKTGTCWVVIGDTYGGSGGAAGYTESTKNLGYTTSKMGATKSATQGFMPKCLLQIPERFSIEMCKRNWILRNTIIWCIMENTMVLTKENKKFNYIPIKDLKVDTKKTLFVPTQDKKGNLIWVKITKIFCNGKKECLKITTKTGREIVCTPEHKFVFKNSTFYGKPAFRKIRVKKASELKIDDYLYVNEDLGVKLDVGTKTDYQDGFIVGFYIAEGSYIKNKIGIYKDSVYSRGAQKRWGRQKKHCKIVGLQFSCGKNDIKRGYIANFKNYKINIFKYGNDVAVHSRDKKLLNLIQKYIVGDGCQSKHCSQEVFNQTRFFIQGLLEGFLAGDGHYDRKNDRHVIGIAPNYELKSDLELLCRFLGWEFRFCNVRKNKGAGCMHMTVRMNPKRNRAFGCIADRVEKIEETGKQKVYDMQIEPFYTGGKGNNQYRRIVKETAERKKAVYNHLYFLGNGIWTHNSKPNCMPSSASDRFTVDFEYLFFFTKSKKYYFEQQFEKYDKPLNRWGGDKLKAQGESTWDKGTGQTTYRNRDMRPNIHGRNKRCVWTITTKPYKGAHFAVFPEALIETPIKASCPEFVCKKCGKAREKIYKTVGKVKVPPIGGLKQSAGNMNPTYSARTEQNIKKEIGYTKCNCNADFSSGIVLDPFFGSGTTAVVAKKLNRDWLGIELNPAYIKLAEKRIANVQKSMF